MTPKKAISIRDNLATLALVALREFSGQKKSFFGFKNVLKLLNISLNGLIRVAHLLGLSFIAFCSSDLNAADPIKFKPANSIEIVQNGNYLSSKCILTTDPTDGKIYLLKNNNLKFTKSLLYDANIGTDLLAAANINSKYYSSYHGLFLSNSSRNDFIALDKDSGNFTLFKNEGSENFSVHSLHNLGTPIVDAFVEDIDNDGDDDIIYSTNSGIGWIKTENSQNFIPQDMLASNLQSITALEVADFDGDGDKDLFFSDQSLNGIGFIENKGSENFSPVNDIGTNSIPIDDLKLVDLDKDGHKDLVFASAQESKIGWMPNNGSENFMPVESLYTQLSGVDVIEVDDSDGNGKVDIYAASSSNDDRLILENDGSGSFIPHLNS